jgi:hypothetical protein
MKGRMAEVIVDKEKKVVVQRLKGRMAGGSVWESKKGGR